MVSHLPLLELAEYVFLFPIAGAAIYAMKKWSYPLFLSIICWGFWRHYQNYISAPTIFSLPLLMSVYFVNLGVVGYFLIPAVREPFFNARLRWWESKPRYSVDSLVATLTGIWGQQDCTILDLSVGGIFIHFGRPLESGEAVKVAFHVAGQDFDISGTVVHYGLRGQKGCGIQFAKLTRVDRKRLNQVTDGLKAQGVLHSRSSSPWTTDLRTWFDTLIRTGHGLIPEKPPALGSRTPITSDTTAESDHKKAA